jgi:hypothetical protein
MMIQGPMAGLASWPSVRPERYLHCGSSLLNERSNLFETSGPFKEFKEFSVGGSTKLLTQNRGEPQCLTI